MVYIIVKLLIQGRVKVETSRDDPQDFWSQPNSLSWSTFLEDENKIKKTRSTKAEVSPKGDAFSALKAKGTIPLGEKTEVA